MSISEQVKNSKYLGAYVNEEKQQFLAGYGSNKNEVLLKTKRLAKEYSKTNAAVAEWRVITNTALQKVIESGTYNKGKIIKD